MYYKNGLCGNSGVRAVEIVLGPAFAYKPNASDAQSTVVVGALKINHFFAGHLLDSLVYSPNLEMYTFRTAFDVCSGAWQTRRTTVRRNRNESGLCHGLLARTIEQRRQARHRLHRRDTRHRLRDTETVRFHR